MFKAQVGSFSVKEGQAMTLHTWISGAKGRPDAREQYPMRESEGLPKEDQLSSRKGGVGSLKER